MGEDHRRYLGVRGVDGGPWRGICALPAFWVGLLYDKSALDAAWDLVKDWSDEERQGLRDAVPRQALDAPFRSGKVLDIARECVSITRAGLVSRAKRDGDDDDETQYLQTIEDIVALGCTTAQQLLESYENNWAGDIDRLFESEAF